MTISQLLNHWIDFLFKKQSPIPMAIFRIAFGVLTLQMALIHVGNCVLLWYGPHGVAPLSSVKTYWWWNQPHLDLFLLFPQTEAGTMTLWTIFIVSLIFLTVGLFTQTAAVFVCLILISLHNHQPFNINGGDAMLRLYAGYLLFSESGAALSFDRLIGRFRNPTFGKASTPPDIIPWGQRMIQVQMSVAYCSTFLHKVNGAQWLDGSAVYYATRLDDMINNQIPLLFNNLFICKLLNWATLLIEGAMFTLVWLKGLRYYVLLAAIGLHVGIDYAINLPVFEFAFMAAFITFVEPTDLRKAADYVKSQINTGFGGATRFTYLNNNRSQTSLASVIEGLDILGRLTIEADESATTERVTAQTSFGNLNGWKLFCWLTCQLPILYPAFPFSGLPFLIMNKPSAVVPTEQT